MPKKLSEKRAPIPVTDPGMGRIVQQIYDDINEIIQSVNNSVGDDRDVSSGKVGDLRVVKRENGDFRLEMMTDDGWYTSKYGTMIPLEETTGLNNQVNKWIEVSDFKNDWENYGSTTTIAFYKENDRVYLKGQVKSGSAGTDSVIFNLSNGYRPEATNIFATIVSGSTIGRIHIRKNGDVVAFSDNGTNKATKLLTLDGISFKTKE